MWASFLGNTGYLGNTRSLIQSTALGSVFQYSRAQETSADLKAFSYLAASGYRTGAFADIWARIMDEADATAAGRKRRSQRYDQVAFFSSHPTSLDRATYLRALAVQAGDQGEVDDVRFHAAMAAWLPQFLDDQLKLNDFGGTEYLNIHSNAFPGGEIRGFLTLVPETSSAFLVVIGIAVMLGMAWLKRPSA